MARSKSSPLSAEKEGEAKALAQRIREATDDDVLQIARLLVDRPEAEIFGDTEFALRDLVLKIGAKALEEHLRQKKTATTAAASTASVAIRPRSPTATGPKTC